MAENKLEIAVQKFTESIDKIDKKESNLYFFVYDTKGRASGELTYIYRTASVLYDLGYKVSMLYTLSEEEMKAGETFIGPGEWMGEKFGKLPHYNIDTDGVTVDPCDIMFIPEVFSEVMVTAMKSGFNCKKVAMLHNFNYIQTFMPTNASWPSLGVMDAVVTTERQKELLDGVFPGMNIKVVRPCIAPMFKKDTDEIKTPTVNVVTRDPADFKRVVSLFYWKYPMFSWVTFQELNTDIKQEVFAEKLRTAPFTVWIDNPTNFGYSALEAMKSGSIVIGKVPEENPEWMFDENGNFAENGLWFYNINDVHGLIARAINAWLNDEFPDTYQKNADKTVAAYSVEAFKSEVVKTYIDGYLTDRKNELVLARSIAKNNLAKENTENNE